ncbi:MAG TPA: hypothetical protein VJ302_37280 [Blastocatellia bacterium]|nr:hypothetical protein [Blastocatellia bacterium]
MSIPQQVESGERSAALEELGKFFSTAKRYTERTGKPAFMPVCIVDKVWHDLLNRPDEYLAFCNEVLGERRAIGHGPIKGTGPVEWVADYEAIFGDLPSIWCFRANGEHDAQAYEQYRKTGILYASWDCSAQEITGTKPAGRSITATAH